jgi:cytochrome c-type biogenesis protein CcmH
MLWGIIALVSVCTVLIVVLPLLRNRDNDEIAPGREAYDVALYKDQLKEIERDLDRGLLTTDQADAARTEIQRKLLVAASDNKKAKSSTTSSGSSGIASAVLVSGFVIAGAVGLYLHLGQPALDNLAYDSRDIKAETQNQRGQQADQEMNDLLSKLARRLEANPNDLKGWLLLGRSLITRGRYEESVAAYKHALDLDPGNLDVVSDYAEALIFSNKGVVNESAYTLLKDALKKSPTDPKIRYYIGLRKAQNDDPIGALQDWTDIAAMSPANAPWMPTITQQINEALNNTGIDPATITPSDEALRIAKERGITPMSTASAGPGPSAEDMQAASQLSEGDRAEMIRGMVNRLAERLENEPDDIAGWKRLAKAYQVLGDQDKAEDALARIKELEK